MMLPRKRRQEFDDGFNKRRHVKSENGGFGGRTPGGDARTWNAQQVHDWILSVQTKSGEVFANEFLENDLNGKDMLDLEKDDFFQQFEHVTNAFAKRKLWRSIEGLRGGAGGSIAHSSDRFPTPPGSSSNKPPPPNPPTKPYSYESQMGLTRETHTPPSRSRYHEEPRRAPREAPPRRGYDSGDSEWDHRPRSAAREGPGHREYGTGYRERTREPPPRGGSYREYERSSYREERPPPEEAVNVVTTGCVKSFLKDRGFGFIAETQTLRDVYFHSSQLRGGKKDEIHDGDMMQFTIVKSAKGWEAHNITPIKTTVAKPRVFGFVSKYTPGGNCGDILDNAGYQIFFFAKDCAEELHLGEYVSFEVMSTQKRPRALRIKKQPETHGKIIKMNMRGGGVISEDNNLKVSFEMEHIAIGEDLQEHDYVKFEIFKEDRTVQARNISTNVDPKHKPKPKNFAGTSRGIVTDYYEEKKYGFIKDLTNGETIFVHEDQIICEPKSLMQDDFVQFDVGVVKKGFKAFNCTKMQLPKPRGKITFFNTDRGFGYVRERQGVDLFFHIKNCEGRPKDPEVDDIVEFDIEGGKKGPMAVNVLWVEPDPDLDEDQPPSQGEIKELRDDHGFILQDAGGPHAYFLPVDLNQDDSPEVGSRVQYAVLPTGKGPKAFNISVIDGKNSDKPRITEGPSHGTFKCFYPAKQIGFVRDHLGKDVFFRREDYVGDDFDVDSLIGAEVKYIIKMDRKGPSAKQITRRDGTPEDASENKEQEEEYGDKPQISALV